MTGLRSSTAFAFALVFTLTAFGPAASSETKRKGIVVVQFAGPKSTRWRNTTIRVIKKQHKLVKDALYAKKAYELEATNPTPDNIALVAQAIRADGILIGTIERKRRRYIVTLKLRAGATGEIIKRTIFKSRSSRVRGRNLRKFRKLVLGMINRLPTLPEYEDPNDQPPDTPKKDPAPPKTDDENPIATKRKRRKKKSETVSVDKTATVTQLKPGEGAEVVAGASLSRRRLSFTVSDGLANPPRGYTGTPVLGAYVAGELYPLRWRGIQGVAGNIGVTGEFDRVIKLESKLGYEDAQMMQMTAQLPTTQTRWGVGLVYRHRLNKTPIAPTLKFSVRYNRLSFTIDKDEAPAGVEVDIPNVDYTYFDPGAGIHYPLTRKFALLGEARFLVVTSPGTMERQNQYGPATILGFDSSAAVEYRFANSFVVRGGVRISGITFDFDGSGVLVNNRDGDPDTPDVGGALDLYLGGYAMLGYLF